MKNRLRFSWLCVLCGVFLLYSNFACSEEISEKLPGAIALYFEGSIYRNSRGGNLQNGCEGWQTLHASGERIFASRCDVERLNRLGLYATEAVRINESLIEARRIKGEKPYLMIDFTSSKVQALHGLTSQKGEVYLIFNSNKILLYYRANGERILLENMGFNIAGLLKANEALPVEKRIQNTDKTLNVVEEKAKGQQMMIGKTKDGKISAVFIDKDGKNLGQAFLK